MANPSFSRHTAQSALLEFKQVQAAVTGAPAGAGFDARWDQDAYAEMRTLQNATSIGSVFSPMMVLDPQWRHNTLAALNLGWAPLTPLRVRSPYAYALPTNPPGVKAP